MQCNEDKKKAMLYLKSKRAVLTVQQYRTLKGQILAGDVSGAKRGIDKLIARNKKKEGCDCSAT